MTTIALNLTLTDPHDPKLTLTTNNLTLNNLRNVTYTPVTRRCCRCCRCSIQWNRLLVTRKTGMKNKSLILTSDIP